MDVMVSSSVLRRVGANWDRAYGAFLGLLCGDAAGATLEFSPGVISEPDVSRAMTMPGGGVFGVGRGQITDDSELALSLARGLLGHRPSDGFPLESVAQQYAAWCASKPFDIGNTCATAFGVEPNAGGNYAATMTQTAAISCSSSEANGSLMRIAPLAIWSVGESSRLLPERKPRCRIRAKCVKTAMRFIVSCWSICCAVRGISKGL